MEKFKNFLSALIAPKGNEAIAVSLAVIIVVISVSYWNAVPAAELDRNVSLRIAEVTFSALGFCTLLLLWASLRHSSVLNKRLTYHEHFHDLPSGNKVEALYVLLQRLGIPTPKASSALTDANAQAIIADTEPPPKKGEIVVREYLNDFEEFAAAVNCGLIDKNYAYHIEGPRTVNAYFGFKAIIERWISLEKQLPHGLETGDAAIYEELRKLSVEWKARMDAESARERSRPKGVSRAL